MYMISGTSPKTVFSGLFQFTLFLLTSNLVRPVPTSEFWHSTESRAAYRPSDIGGGLGRIAHGVIEELDMTSSGHRV